MSIVLAIILGLWKIIVVSNFSLLNCDCGERNWPNITCNHTTNIHHSQSIMKMKVSLLVSRIVQTCKSKNGAKILVCHNLNAHVSDQIKIHFI